MTRLRVILLTIVLVLMLCNGGSISFVFDQCNRRHTNLTTQECVGKLIINTLTKVTADPAHFLKINELDNESGIRLIKLKFDNDTMNIDKRYVINEGRSLTTGNVWDQLLYVIKTLFNYSSDHGVLVSLPQPSIKFPSITVIDEDEILEPVEEGRKHTHNPYKKYALLFPLLATFKFLLIKALLVPILVAVVAIKKMMILGVMALPTVLTMLRFCRNPNFPGFGPGNLMAAGAVGPIGPAAAFAPLTADMSGDYSTYVQQAAASHQNAAYKDYSKNLIDAMKANTYQRRR